MDKGELLLEFIATADTTELEDIEREINEGLYTLSETSCIIDNVDSISFEQAIQVWQLIEAIRQNGFPEDLKM